MTHRTLTGLFRRIAIYILLTALFGLFVWALFGTPLGRNLVQSWLNAPTAKFNNSPMVVTQLQALNRLETASQVSQQVVEASADRKFLPAVFGKDRLLMQVQTEMIAGIDLGKLSQDDVRVNGQDISVRLPAPVLFSVRIDDEHTRVFSRERGLMVLSPDVTLEGQARQQVLAQARTTARELVLPAARVNAETNMRQLLSTMGFSSVDIRWVDQAS